MKYIYPKNIIINENVENIQSVKKIKPLQIGLNEKDCFTLKSKSRLLLDFEVELSGGVRIITYKVKGKGTLKIVFGESVSECLSKLREYNSTNDHSTRDMVVNLQSLSDMTIGNTGFRFVLLESVDYSEFEIKNIVAVSETTELPYIGSFRCDDDIINNIFSTASRTLSLCINNGMIWDGIKRDRLVWAGDLHPEVLGVCHLFGKLDNVESSLEFIKAQTDKNKWINDIPSYSLWWIITLRDYFEYTNNIEFVSTQLDYVMQIVELIDNSILNNGEINYGFNFVNWDMYSTNENDTEKRNDELCALQALTIIALQKAKEIFKIFNVEYKICDNIINRLKKKEHSVKRYKPASAFRVLAGIATNNDKEILLNNNFDTFSTFMSYYVLKAIDLIDNKFNTLKTMTDYYNAMLDLGSTTFWEQFNYLWKDNALKVNEIPNPNKVDIYRTCGKDCYLGLRKSLCHGWSCGPIQYLFQVIGGINVTKTGCKEIEIKPNLFNLNMVNISFPTPYGVVKVNHKKERNKVTTSITAPKEVKIKLIE